MTNETLQIKVLRSSFPTPRKIFSLPPLSSSIAFSFSLSLSLSLSLSYNYSEGFLSLNSEWVLSHYTMERPFMNFDGICVGWNEGNFLILGVPSISNGTLSITSLNDTSSYLSWVVNLYHFLYTIITIITINDQSTTTGNTSNDWGVSKKKKKLE